ncbi:protein-disulfide reductase DsbD family protein [Niabella insulamsoli]|uniref:protein-disulfide reductase DsbD family protein n=1 Tax=Niabella insulamsoli TaxID=3144874 RepID=UPI0031FDCFE7
MNFPGKHLVVFFLLLITATAFSQDSADIKFSFSYERKSSQTVQLDIKAFIQKPGISFFGLQQTPEDAVFSQIVFDSAATKFLEGAIEEKGTAQTQTDPDLELPVRFFTDSVHWLQNLSIAEGDTAVIKGKLIYLYKSGTDFPSGEKDFRVVVAPKTAKAEVPADKESGAAPESLWVIFLAGLGAGLLALIMPCIYSMIPITVSFFTKRSKTKKEGIKNALLYAVSIITIFTFLGVFISLVFGPEALNVLSTHWIPNIIFFLMFVVFGISFLGAFEIELPASWGNKVDSKANSKSIVGIFFMALTLVIVSFSCTVPFLGGLLVLVSKGDFLAPIIGFFGFSLMIALPFAFFAFFPSKLNSLGKAGGWLNAIKVSLGFLELALALKFLSNADLTQNWRILDREIFIVLWVVIFLLLGLYLLGKLKFKHDDELPKNDFGLPFLSVTRLFFAIASLAFMVYLVPGLFGAPLKGLSAFLPPMGTQDFNADDLPKGFRPGTAALSGNATSEAGALPEPVKYAEVMKKNEPDVVVNNGLITYFDYDEALAIAQQLKKPLMLDFTGVNCINCRKMEGSVWSHPEVMKKLKEDFVIASLFVDVHNGVELPVAEQYFSKTLDKQIETLGQKNTDIQVSQFGTSSQPNYFFVDGHGNRLIEEGYGYDPDVKKFLAHLDRAIEAYKEAKGN